MKDRRPSWSWYSPPKSLGGGESACCPWIDEEVKFIYIAAGERGQQVLIYTSAGDNNQVHIVHILMLRKEDNNQGSESLGGGNGEDFKYMM